MWEEVSLQDGINDGIFHVKSNFQSFILLNIGKKKTSYLKIQINKLPRAAGVSKRISNILTQENKEKKDIS